MNKKLYNLMDWAAIEEIVYAESVHPENILGASKSGNSTLVQCFFPGATSVSMVVKNDKNNEYKMEEADEAGFYAVLVPLKHGFDYEYQVMYKGKKKPVVCQEIYGKYDLIDNKILSDITLMDRNDVHRTLGAHVVKNQGVSGTRFAVYAPNALRVSVIGDFNNYDESIHQMIRHDECGVFELFVPGVKAGMKYNYEILIKGGDKLIKCDPFALKCVMDEGIIRSVVDNSNSYKFVQKKCVNASEGLRIYEICQDFFIKNADIDKMSQSVINHVKENDYTHVELMPVLDCYNDSMGFIPSSLFAYDHNFKKIDDLKKFIDKLHENNIGVILQMPLAYFDNGPASFGYYDGSCLFEHEDYRKGIDPRSGAKIYQYSNAFVRNMLLSAVSRVIEDFNADGIKLMDVASMMYLDYYRDPQEWIPNDNGSNENYEAAGFVTELNKFIHDKYNIITISSDKISWIDTVTSDNENLGFDYVLNNDFNNILFDYLSVDPINRFQLHNNMLELFKIYDNKQILSVTHSDVDLGKGGIINRFFGDSANKMASMKLYLGLMMTISRNIAVFMGQDLGDSQSFDINYSLVDNKEIKTEQKNILKFFKEFSKFSSLLNNGSIEIFDGNMSRENIVTYVIKDKNKIKYFVTVNFANCKYDKIRVTVPCQGKYSEVFNSDSKLFGGSDVLNKRVLPSKFSENEEVPASISINTAPLSFNVFEYKAFTKNEITEMQKRNKERQQLMETRLGKKAEMIKEKNRIKAEILKELDKKMTAANKKILEK